MKATCLLVPILAIGATACGGSGSTTTQIHFDASTGWTGTAEVLVHTPAGDLVSRGPLAAGDSDLALDDGDTVTVAISDGTSHRLQTAFGVQRGDVIYARAVPPWPDGYHKVTIQVPAVANVDAYLTDHPDGASYDHDAPSAIVLPGRTSVPVMVAALDASHQVLAVFGDAAAPISGDTIDLSAKAPLDLSNVDLAITGAPAGGTITTAASFWTGSDQVSVPTYAASDTTLGVPDGLGDVRSISVFADDGATSGVAKIQATSGSFPAQLAVDLGQVAVPALSAGAYDGTRVTWTIGTGDFDGYFGGLGYPDQSSWVLMAPAGAADMTLPAIPAELLPTAAPDSGYLYAFAYDGDDYHGYLAGPVAPGDGDTWQARATKIAIAGAPAAPAAISRARLERGLRAVVTRR